MSAPVTIQEGDLIVHDPDATKLYHFDWTNALATGVTISGLPTTIITVLRPANSAAALAALVQSSNAVDGTALRHQVKLATPLLGAKYRITSRIVTNESPSQTLDGSFELLGQQE